MASESDIEAAAERVERWCKCCERGDHDDHEYWEDAGQQQLDESVLVDWAIARLAADRAERDERALPIDAEWLSSIFDEEFDEAFSSRSIMLGVLVPACGRCGWTWVVGDVHVATVTTRGQLLDLLRVLKGGAE